MEKWWLRGTVPLGVRHKRRASTPSICPRFPGECQRQGSSGCLFHLPITASLTRRSRGRQGTVLGFLGRFCVAAPHLYVNLADNFASKPVPISAAATLASAHTARVWSRGGLRLQRLRKIQGFLTAGPCVASAVSYHFASVAPPRWRFAFSQFAPVVKVGLPVLAIGSNCSSQPTGYAVG